MIMVSSKRLAAIMSEHEEFQAFEIGEDNEGQLVIYTGLYRHPDDSSTWVLPDENAEPSDLAKQVGT